MPDVPVFAEGIDRAVTPTQQAGGQVVTLTASARGPQDTTRLQEMFGAARSADWKKRSSRWSGCGAGTGT
ncbi:hypothetical protein AQI95_05750 [Streptomyces yokosukanensis]|uniref:ChrB N-terminal domain-containing protein n=1 Tax=Streptomyces yokosukanensis TaxID=67386 RepID=A0A101PD47_9ACTN|nr:hypothetical protein AQI95_05750 [Streptomyces yokosukanensis]